MSDLAEFLLARIAEDEEVAREALEEAPGRDGRWVATTNRPNHRHEARWDPARVLAECEARRAIVKEWVDADRAAGGYPGTGAGIEMGLFAALGHLAAAYADHPDYREE